MLSLLRSGLTASLIASSALTASAAVTYVDATSGVSGNTTLANGSTFSPPLNGTTGADNNWEQRTTFGSSGNIFESGGEQIENAPEIKTTITGLTVGQTYGIRVFFWDGSGPNPDWNVRAGFASGATTLFANGVDTDATDLGATPAVLASSLTYTTAPTVFTESDRTLFSGLVGNFVADSNGQIAVFIDDLPPTIAANQRTWYDGVGYEAVPEPASMALVGLGMVALLRRRSQA